MCRIATSCLLLHLDLPKGLFELGFRTKIFRTLTWCLHLPNT
jgi:hypothetical protein